MRKSPTIEPRKCTVCGQEYTPSGNRQWMCSECGKKHTKLYKKEWTLKKYPERSRKKAETAKCCVCGGEFSAHYDGKPYCNKHWLRMYRNGNLDIQRRKSTCKFVVDENVLKIITKRGDIILADPSDLNILKKYSWCVSKEGYAVANIGGHVVKMNRYILGLEQCGGKIVDHINRNRLDNRRKNLRFATYSGNAQNSTRARNSKSPYLGVRITPNGKYEVRITINRKTISLGRYDTLEESIIARINGENKYHGEYASHIGSQLREAQYDKSLDKETKNE